MDVLKDVIHDNASKSDKQSSQYTQSPANGTALSHPRVDSRIVLLHFLLKARHAASWLSHFEMNLIHLGFYADEDVPIARLRHEVTAGCRGVVGRSS